MMRMLIDFFWTSNSMHQGGSRLVAWWQGGDRLVAPKQDCFIVHQFVVIALVLACLKTWTCTSSFLDLAVPSWHSYPCSPTTIQDTHQETWTCTSRWTWLFLLGISSLTNNNTRRSHQDAVLVLGKIYYCTRPRNNPGAVKLWLSKLATLAACCCDACMIMPAWLAWLLLGVASSLYIVYLNSSTLTSKWSFGSILSLPCPTCCSSLTPIYQPGRQVLNPKCIDSMVHGWRKRNLISRRWSSSDKFQGTVTKWLMFFVWLLPFFIIGYLVTKQQNKIYDHFLNELCSCREQCLEKLLEEASNWTKFR